MEEKYGILLNQFKQVYAAEMRFLMKIEGKQKCENKCGAWGETWDEIDKSKNPKNTFIMTGTHIEWQMKHWP